MSKKCNTCEFIDCPQRVIDGECSMPLQDSLDYKTGFEEGYYEGLNKAENDFYKHFRANAAKDILCALLMSGYQDLWSNTIREALKATDMLIESLKDGK